METSEVSVVGWRSELLPGSETFVRSQTSQLPTWRAVLIGNKKRQSALTSPDDVILYGSNLFERLLLRFSSLTGRAPRLARALSSCRPKLVHAHFGMDAVIIAGLCKKFRLPLVISIYGMDVTALPQKRGLRGVRYRYRLGRAFRVADQILAVSQFLADKAVELGADPQKVRVHHLGVEIRDLEYTPETSWDIIAVGRLVEKKGFDDLVSALTLLREHHGLRPRVVIVGDGPLRQQLENRVSETGVNVRFLGALPPKELSQVLAKARLLCAPSKTAANGDCEGLPMIILEAMAQELPVVSTWHSGIPEAVEHGVTGLLTKEGNYVELARNLKDLLEDSDRRRQFGLRGRMRVVEQYNLTIQNQRLEQIYASVAGRDCASRP